MAALTRWLPLLLLFAVLPAFADPAATPTAPTTTASPTVASPSNTSSPPATSNDAPSWTSLSFETGTPAKPEPDKAEVQYFDVGTTVFAFVPLRHISAVLLANRFAGLLPEGIERIVAVPETQQIIIKGHDRAIVTQCATMVQQQDTEDKTEDRDN